MPKDRDYFNGQSWSWNSQIQTGIIAFPREKGEENGGNQKSKTKPIPSSNEKVHARISV